VINMTALDGKTPRNMPATAAKSDFDQEGLILMKNSSANSLELAAAVTDSPVAILDQAVVDATGTVRATRTGEKVGVFLLGCGAIVNVACMTGKTFTIGQAVYVGQTADDDGHASDSSANSAKKIGHYAGDGVVTSSTGQLIPVILDIPVLSA
jgi:hypothetical protein